MTSTHLTGAGSAKAEDQSLIFNQTLHFVEELRDLLNLVENDQLTSLECLQFVTQQVRALQVAHLQIGLEKIPIDSAGISRPEEPALARLSGSPKEETVTWSLRQF